MRARPANVGSPSRWGATRAAAAVLATHPIGSSPHFLKALRLQGLFLWCVARAGAHLLGENLLGLCVASSFAILQEYATKTAGGSPPS